MARTFKWELSEYCRTEKGMKVVRHGEFVACTRQKAKGKATKASQFGHGYWTDALYASYKSPNQRRVTTAPSLKLWTEDK